ncbi:hypothetical protein [Dyella sp. 2RAB6]|uniref:hypothetical protein n=1 Tax=Dyella sp. 2RAB6 TaxID=3232992 RepID=UPI003F904BE7
MSASAAIATRLEVLRQDLPDPFAMAAQLDAFFAQPATRELLAESTTGERLLDYLENQPEPSLARVAVILLARCLTDPLYQRLLAVLERADLALTEACETGLWLLPVDQAALARALVSMANAAHPLPLLLLQRPVAVEVRASLEHFIRAGEMPLSLYALYAYAYIPKPRDNALLSGVSRRLQQPALCAEAGLQLLQAHDLTGLPGIREGLRSADAELRETTYARLAPHLSEAAAQSTHYDVMADPASQYASIDRLLESLRHDEAKP